MRINSTLLPHVCFPLYPQKLFFQKQALEKGDVVLYSGPSYIQVSSVLCDARDTHQAAEGVIKPVVQRESLHHLKKRGVVKATGVSGDKLIHAMFLSSVSVYPANGTGKSTRFRGEDISEAQASSKSSSQKH